MIRFRQLRILCTKINEKSNWEYDQWWCKEINKHTNTIVILILKVTK